MVVWKFIEIANKVAGNDVICQLAIQDIANELKRIKAINYIDDYPYINEAFIDVYIKYEKLLQPKTIISWISLFLFTLLYPKYMKLLKAKYRNMYFDHFTDFINRIYVDYITLNNIMSIKYNNI